MLDVHTRIKRAIEGRIQSGASQTEIAQKCGLSQATIYKYLYSKPRPDIVTLGKFALGLNIDFYELIGSMPQVPTSAKATLKKKDKQPTPTSLCLWRKVPILNWKQVPGWKNLTGPVHSDLSKDYIETDVPGARMFAIRVTDDSMEPEFRVGELVLVNPELEAMPNDYVLTIHSDHGSEEAALKQLKKLGNRSFLHPLNPSYGDIPLTKNTKLLAKWFAVKRITNAQISVHTEM